ncbi:undecaprenyl-diphosphate phosphatase [Sphingopyxis sp. BSNA05]|uniref:undecaprenyl-diphosphate phosphatase n=1 Tax=Sphingopyxis sp. BSNA05 TaxID=1236614 RepID=UPI0020B859FA|nr:undecaprenyl-diphosphate phosphatase [Sphingopyxis sp. BSNA05]
MTFMQMLLLAIVQGVTEFLPISSSGHLILLPVFTGYADQGPMIDIAVHVGSLLAIITYFFKDVWSLGRGGLATIGIGQAPAEKRLFWWIILGTIPAVIVGLFLKTGGYLDGFRSTTLVAVNLIVYGILLGIADRFGRQVKSFEDLTLKDGIIVGLAQAMALIPGTSRSGVTMTAARFLGYTRVEAARFSFLLSIPAVAARRADHPGPDGREQRVAERSADHRRADLSGGAGDHDLPDALSAQGLDDGLCRLPRRDGHRSANAFLVSPLSGSD